MKRGKDPKGDSISVVIIRDGRKIDMNKISSPHHLMKEKIPKV